MYQRGLSGQTSRARSSMMDAMMGDPRIKAKAKSLLGTKENRMLKPKPKNMPNATLNDC